ncbi:arsenate reductase family protein [Spirochaetota bacterium]
MSLQIFGTKKCATTRKAERFFKERDVDYQFVDLADKGISPGELKAVIKALGKDGLLDPGSKYYVQKGLKYMDFDIEEEILADPLLMRTPVVRDGSTATMGDDAGAWARFAVAAKAG